MHTAGCETRPRASEAIVTALSSAGGSAGGYLTPMAASAWKGACELWCPTSDTVTSSDRVTRNLTRLSAPGACVEGGGLQVRRWQRSVRFFPGQPSAEIYLYCRQNGLWPKQVGGHDPRTDAKWFDQYCPVQNVTARYPPTVLIHGTDDTDVPYSLAQQMDAELSRAGVEHEFITVSGAGHGLTGAKPEEIAQVASRAVQFVQTHPVAGATPWRVARSRLPRACARCSRE
jgi:pimeloyl-ACP methyl ester carboxylesterase